jgi:hypothetical protein
MHDDQPAVAVAAGVERSPADVLRVVVGAVALLLVVVVESLFGTTLVDFGSDLLAGLDTVPAWLLDLVILGTRFLGLALFVGGSVVALYRRRWRLVATATMAAIVAGLLAALLGWLFPTDAGQDLVDTSIDAGPLTDTDGIPLAVTLAAGIAVLTAAAPWLSRRWRRAGSALAAGLIITCAVEVPLSFDALWGASAGWLAGSAVLVLIGAPSRRPTPQAVIDGLARVGLRLRRIEQAGVDARGSTPYFAVGEDGEALFVKVLGEDERAADLLFRLYRWVQPRAFGDERPFSTLRRGVEHEALVALAARDLGIRTPRLRAFATAEPNGYVLAYESIAGRSLDRLDPAEVTDGVLDAIWALLCELHSRGVAHRDLRLANVFLGGDGEVWLIDFGFSELAASDLLLGADVAELIASSSVYVGATRAVTAAAAAVDRDTLSRALDRMRPWALSGATRSGLKSRPGLLSDLRRELAAAARASDRP